MRLHELPDDILIAVISTCDVQTILSVRLSCASFCAIVSNYINTIAPAVARYTFPQCDVLLKRPTAGYSIRWLRDLLHLYLASVVLDKDKLRRSPYWNSGFPYGIPSESGCELAVQWRKRIATGWRVLKSFHLVSQNVYDDRTREKRRPSALGRLSGGLRSSRLWQSVSCPYLECAEHRMLDGRDRRESRWGPNSTKEDRYEHLKRRESKILKQRLNLLEQLKDDDLLSYVYLWRLLLWTFRPYRKPDTIEAIERLTENTSSSPDNNWSAIIDDIAQGCSWLNWFVLFVGPQPFIDQWAINPENSYAQQPYLLRDMIWKTYGSRTPHQIEVEREYICKFEFAVRCRCLSSDRRKRLEGEIYQGRTIRTISLDCIPWQYDQAPIIRRDPQDFPWYSPGQWLWMNKDWSLLLTGDATWGQRGSYRSSVTQRDRRNCQKGQNSPSDLEPDIKVEDYKGPLEHVSYLVYLGHEFADRVWKRDHDNSFAF
ncbi:hypothetical protein T440DRAFT_540304 [Plenodomus tracheiphilus IPT5]|uniref:F-box domain-containing protein n=1 Tax=Plenodomus tracheiphilus IPT5 TaxID=1408161 RepID=A0A6A7AUB7_9PLEO|nr:hypothetical protein T440DRAFT_540304 [Plenodomus tracheiphilus IPT5]